MRARRLATIAILGAVLASMLSAGTPAQSAGACADAGGQGCWSKPFSPLGKYDEKPPATRAESAEFPTAASAIMLPSGRIVYWNGLQNLENCNDFGLTLDAGRCAGNSTSEVLDLTGAGTAQFFSLATNGGDDLFCADQRLLQNGTVFTAGGTHWETQIPIPSDPPVGQPGGLAELYGSKDTHLITDGGEWTLGSKMNFGRWYPSMLTLPSGNMFIAGGVSKLLWNSNSNDPRASDSMPKNVVQTEVYDLATGAWTKNPDSANVALPLFARLHLLPSGDVFYGGAGQMWGPAGESVDQLEWNWQKLYDPVAKTWRSSAMPVFGARSGTFSALLPLRPPYTQAQVLMGGGVLGTSPGTELATNLSELTTIKAGSDGTWASSSERTADMANRRWYSSAVVLPNGQVIAVSGGDKDEVVEPGFEVAIRQAELWDGAKWVGLSSATRERTYHNSALLLPDGSVLVGGHAPINQGYGGKGAENNNANGFANNLKDPSFERFYPPYLYHGPRPVIDTAQSHATWGGDLVITMDPSGHKPVKQIVLSRLPGVTHTTDADNRTVELPGFTAAGTEIRAEIPTNRNVVPPGYYYVFAMTANGTPSVATILQIADPADYDGRPAGATPVELVDSPVR